MQRLPELITSLHKQGVVRSSWQQFAQDASELFQADGCSFHYRELANTQQPTVFGVGVLGVEQTGAVFGSESETLLQQMLRNSPVGEVIKQGNIELGTETDESQSIERLSQIVAATVYRDDRYEAIFSFGRHKGNNQFAESDVELLNEFIPYLELVAKSYFQDLKQNQLNGEQIGISQFIDQFNQNLAVIDDDGVILASNRSFDKLRVSKSLVYVYGGKVNFYDKSVMSWLFSTLGRKFKKPACHFIHLNEQQHDCVIKLSSFNHRDVEKRRGSKRYFLLSIDNFDVNARFEQYKQLFGLTKAEAELAAYLSIGKTVNELAIQKLLSKHTLRTQLKSVFAKTNTHSQNELIVLLKNVF